MLWFTVAAICHKFSAAACVINAPSAAIRPLINAALSLQPSLVHHRIVANDATSLARHSIATTACSYGSAIGWTAAVAQLTALLAERSIHALTANDFEPPGTLHTGPCRVHAHVLGRKDLFCSAANPRPGASAGVSTSG